MKQVNPLIVFRSIVAVTFLTPLVLGCGGAPPVDSSSQTPAPTPVAAPDPAPADDLAPAGQPAAMGAGNAAPAEQAADAGAPLSDADLAAQAFATEEPADDRSGTAADEPAVSPPRSLFRSIGRALQKGVTDATRGGAASSQEETQPGPDSPP